MSKHNQSCQIREKECEKNTKRDKVKRQILEKKIKLRSYGNLSNIVPVQLLEVGP